MTSETEFNPSSVVMYSKEGTGLKISTFQHGNEMQVPHEPGSENLFEDKFYKKKIFVKLKKGSIIGSINRFSCY